MTPAEIVFDTCYSFGITPKRLLSDAKRNKWKSIVMARRAVATRLRNELKMSYPEIGHLLKRDHSSVWTLVNGRKKKKTDDNP
jgi:chromosomal replication initiation ATPase DnaA